MSKLIKLIKYRQSIIKKSSKNLKNLHKFSSLSKKKIIKAFQFYKLNWNYKRQFYLSLRASSDAEALSFAFAGKDHVNFRYRLKFRRQNLPIQVLRAGLLSRRSLNNLKRFRKKKFFGTRYKDFVKKPVFNFVRYALFSDLNSLSKISNLNYYINEFHNANKLNLNLKRLTHANLYS